MLQWYSMVVIYTHKNAMKLITGIDQIWRLVSRKTVEFYFNYHYIIVRSLKVSKPFSWAFLCHLLMHEVFIHIARIGIVTIPDWHKTVITISWLYRDDTGVIWLMTLVDLAIQDGTNGTAHFKNVNNYLNINIYSYFEKSGGQSSNLYLNVVRVFNTSVN